jgi:hypothetical protein
MKKILTTVIIALLCSSMFTILVRAQLLTADVYVDPPTFTAQVGETFDVNVTVSNVQNLWAWQAGVQWDKNILQVVSFTWGDFQEALAYYTVRLDPVIDGTAGKTSTPALETAIGFSTIPVSSNAPVKLLTITFQAIGVGSSTVSLTDVALIGQDPTVTTSYPRWSDVNFDSYVDMKDITITIKSYLNISPYNQDADFNNDGTIDITDIAIVTSDFAKWSWGPDWRVTKTIYEITAILQSCSVITFNVINTPTGTSVAVSLLAGDVTLSFDSVTSSGITEAATTDTGPEAPTGFLLGAPGTEPIYYEITTTATYYQTNNRKYLENSCK